MRARWILPGFRAQTRPPSWHLLQVNLSNGLDSSPAQVAGGADHEDWFIGFNITRKFY